MHTPQILCLFLLSIIFSLANTVNGGSACGYKATDGSVYDLSKLRLLNSSYDFVSGTSKYEVNVCGNLPALCYSMDSASCRYSEIGTEWNSGSADVIEFADHPKGPEKGVQLRYPSGGEPCWNGPRTTIIVIDCMAGAKPTIYDVIETAACETTVRMLAGAACPEKRVCAYKATDGSIYDLSSLTTPDSEYYFQSGIFGYGLNVCGNLPKLCFSLKSASCRYQRESGIEWANGNADIIEFTDHPDGPTKGVQVRYPYGGEPCTDGGRGRRTVIVIDCMAGVNPAIYNVSDNGGCEIALRMIAGAACPKSGGGGGGNLAA